MNANFKLLVKFFLFLILLNSYNSLAQTKQQSEITKTGLSINDSLNNSDSLLPKKCLIILNDGKEYYAELLSIKDDYISLISDTKLNLTIPLEFLTCIITSKELNFPNHLNYSSKNFIVHTPSKLYKFASKTSVDELNYYLKCENDTILAFDKFSFYNDNFPCFLNCSIEWYNPNSKENTYLLLSNDCLLEGQIINKSSNFVRLIIDNKYLIKVPNNLIEKTFIPYKMPDTLSGKFPTHKIFFKDGYNLEGNLISKNNDSVIVKINNGKTVIISNNEISDINKYDYYKKNVFYIDLAFGLGSYFNLNYERLINRWMSLKFSYGIGVFPTTKIFNTEPKSKSLPIIIFNLLPGKNNSRGELGIGISYLENKIYPAVNYGYRYQSDNDNSLFFRIGMSHYLGFSVYLSVGKTF